MKSMRWLLVLLLVCALPAQADDTRKASFVVGADVDAQGVVTQTQVDAGVSKPIAGVIDLALKHWTFVPAQQEGKALPAHTFIKIKFEATTDASGKYTVTIRYVSQGPKWDYKLPHYPRDAMRDRVEGDVAVIGEMQSDGKTTISDSQMNVGKGDGASLLQEVKNLILKNKFIPELVDGKPVPARLRILVSFSLNGASSRLNSVGATLDRRRMGRSTSRGYCGVEKQTTSDDALEMPNEATRRFMASTGFEVGIHADRGWRSGMSSVLRPRAVNPIAMHL
ncbi:energy transducer TonB [Rhodanobacter sp. L36]|uniref:energy transducer TonB n=1 Tax=Rhodanobacter sp. L36 TaxID=1747221 RepID=UPI00131C2BB5|nr:energy transducer TonB [Rhodanobacter sp. L36]